MISSTCAESAVKAQSINKSRNP